MGTWSIPDEWVGYRICSNCGAKMQEGYMLAGEYACSDECAIALYGGDEAQLRADIEEEIQSPASTDCIWTYWYGE